MYEVFVAFATRISFCMFWQCVTLSFKSYYAHCEATGTCFNMCIATYVNTVVLFGYPIKCTYVGRYTDDAEGVDYVYQNYRFSFEDGEDSKSLIIRTIDDNIVEPDENYTLVINASTITTGLSPETSNYRVIVGENGTTTITILNDDGKIRMLFLIRIWTVHFIQFVYYKIIIYHKIKQISFNF